MKGKIGNEHITENDVFKGYLSKELGKWETSDDPIMCYGLKTRF